MSPEMQTVVITALISAITSSGLMSLIVFLIQRRDQKKEKEEANNTAQSRMLLGLGHDRILRLTDKFIRRGAITLKEKRNLEFLCAPYFDLGGNGDCRIGYEACQKLNVISEELAEEMDIKIIRKEFGFNAE
jgi:hypothetical protein